MPIKIISFETYDSDKIKSLSEIVSVAEVERSVGKKVGLCVGGYDLIHPGHMTHLISAKSFCDVLIIGVTAEEFNAQRKGVGRPIYPDELRAFSVSQLDPVDYVFISQYKGAVEVISQIRPHFYIKGPDFITKQTPGITAEREAIKSVGGEMRYTEDEKLSTTEIIQYIQREIK